MCKKRRKIEKNIRFFSFSGLCVYWQNKTELLKRRKKYIVFYKVTSKFLAKYLKFRKKHFFGHEPFFCSFCTTNSWNETDKKTWIWGCLLQKYKTKFHFPLPVKINIWKFKTFSHFVPWKTKKYQQTFSI